ncbi:MAG: acetylornithine deacetylase [Alphaproteobacteria bacterium]|jgi:acetylornithine deacetylase|nr:acetylornithine deacetylase [Alphaproteobacteria bacterium]
MTEDILERLIAFDTTSRNSNLELIAWVEAFLAARGVASRRVENDDGDKANLVAIVGPAVEGGVVLSGHTDVVPVDGQPWTTDPFVLTRKDERLYGRGVSDMKSFLALALAHIDAALAASIKRPLILAFSYDEEIGCLGAPRLVEKLGGIAPKPEAVIIGEPTEMQVVSGHKSISTFIVDMIGREAHSSQIRQGVSAIMAALPLMTLIAEMGAEAQAAADPSSPFDPPGATMTIGTVEGGSAVNILARQCRFVWDLRCPPDEDPGVYEARFRAKAAEIERAMQAVAPEARIEITRRSDTKGLRVDLGSPAERLLRALTGDNATRTVAFATEAGIFQNAGFPAAVCGPGSIAQAHQPDEWIALDQLRRGEAFFQKLIARLAA